MDEHNKAQTHEHEHEQDRVDPEREAPLNEAPGDAPDDERGEEQRESRRRRVPRLVLVGLGLAGVMVVLVLGLMSRAGDETDTPTLEAQVRQQQQALDQLRAQLDELQQQDDEVVIEARGMASGLDRRLDELSASVDVRFSAVQEKQEALEKAIEEGRRPEATQGEAATKEKGAESETGSESESESVPDALPSFDADPIRHLTQNLSAPKPGAEGEGESKPEPDSKSDSEADTKPEKVVAESAPEPESKPQPKPRRRYTPPSPPFTVSGLEIRGGNRFVAVMFGEGRRLSDLRLVGEGQSVGGWRLSSIYGHSATFIVNGKSVDVSIP
ncbi:hypothetical protein FGL86_05750 [Pistricoccus aurantiacus]|uniref:Uncharacterized protein n=1 Tax=Pistricoccus aurantiacus TaxID=1883414 RepID=A0A5B8SQQ3_9GAMM|nr:hypothetical protein [Pistricoccus aurantiacus]QEA38631.1 hypothetical protein FGL86_05750 [Pistricoccus aurantiacus]